MKFRNLLAATAAVSMIATPALAQSVEAERMAAPVTGQSLLGNGDDDDASGAGIILAILAAAAIIAGIVVAGGNEDDSPASP